MVDLYNVLLVQVCVDYGLQVVLIIKDNDIFDLLDMFYGQIQCEVCYDVVVVDLLICLQVLVVCVVLFDFVFFVCDQYLVCELFNVVVEVGVIWLGEEDVDLQLVVKFSYVVDQVVQNYKGDMVVFDVVNDDIQQYFCVLVYKVELVECWYVEVVCGKECLELVKQQVSVSIEQLCVQVVLLCFVQFLFKQVWLDILILILLCYGEELLQWQQCQEEIVCIVVIICQLLGVVDSDIVLGEQVEVVLLQVGYYQDEVVVIVCWLFMFGGEDDSMLWIELIVCLKVCICFGEQVDSVDLCKVVLLVCSMVEEDCYCQLCMLLFGIWFEFIINQ